MAVVATRKCDLPRCARAITGRIVEVRMVVSVHEADGTHYCDFDARAEVCSPACAVTVARAAIDCGFAA